MWDLEPFLITLSFLIIISVILAKWTNNTGFPYLLLFLIVGMLAGSEGVGGIHFDNPEVAKNVGVAALVLILFSGGLGTNWSRVKKSTGPAVVLATFGVLATSASLGVCAYFVLNISPLQALLLGSVVASTDAAAVFSILGGKKLALKNRVKYLLELESGSNDPMAVFLTISCIQLITSAQNSVWGLILAFVLQMALGLLFGLAGGRVLVWLINKLRFPVEGFYPVFMLAFAFFIYSGTTLLMGSGFLAVYVTAIVVNNSQLVYKKSMFRFFDGIAWLAQISMFLTLGLLVFPSELVRIVPYGIIISLFLIFIARPAGVFLSLLPFRFKFKEMLYISWVGLRGAVPIILATFPLLAGVPGANLIFNIVFFIVLTSAILQGWTIPFMAKKLKLLNPEEDIVHSPIEFVEGKEENMSMVNITVPDNPDITNKALVDFPELKGSLIVLILRAGKYVVPSGGTTFEPGDKLQILTEQSQIETVKNIFKN